MVTMPRDYGVENVFNVVDVGFEEMNARDFEERFPFIETEATQYNRRVSRASNGRIRLRSGKIMQILQSGETTLYDVINMMWSEARSYRDGSAETCVFVGLLLVGAQLLASYFLSQHFWWYIVGGGLIILGLCCKWCLDKRGLKSYILKKLAESVIVTEQEAAEVYRIYTSCQRYTVGECVVANAVDIRFRRRSMSTTETVEHAVELLRSGNFYREQALKELE